MMATLREQILQAAADALNTGAPAGIPQFVRTQMLPTETAHLPFGTLFPVAETVNGLPSGRFGPIVERTLTMRVVVYNQGNPADGSLDDGIAWVTQTLNGNRFDGLATDTIEADYTWTYNESNFAVGMVAIDFSVTYQTLRADQTARN